MYVWGKPGSLRRKVIINGAIVIGAIVVALGLVEGILRLIGVTPQSDRLSIYEFHEELGWWPRQDFRYYRSTRYYAHFNYYNSLRMPTSEADFSAAPDHTTPAIALIGDSFVESYYVPYEKSFPYLLDRAFDDEQVINLGVSGYSPEQYLLRARYELPKYNVDKVVVVLFAFNDVPATDRTNYQAYNKPVFGDDLKNPMNTPLVRSSETNSGGSILRQIANKSAIYTLLRPFYKGYINPTEEAEVTPESMRLDDAQYAKAIRVIAAIKDLKPEAEFYITYMPMYQEIMDGEAFERGTSRFLQLCREADLQCYVPEVNSFSPEELRRLFIEPMRGDGHLSETGSAWYATFLLEALGK